MAMNIHYYSKERDILSDCLGVIICAIDLEIIRLPISYQPVTHSICI